MNGWVALFQVNDISRNAIGIDRALAWGGLGASIGKAKHAADNKTFGFVGDGSAVHTGLATAFSGGFAMEDDGPNGFVVVLDGINKLGANVGKVVLSGHLSPP